MQPERVEMRRRKGRRSSRTPSRSSKGPRVPKRTRAKIRGRLKRRFGLNRRQLGAIGAGHREAPPGYTAAVAGALELARSRMLA